MSDVCCPDDDEPRPEKARVAPRRVSSWVDRPRTVLVEAKRRRILQPKDTPNA